MSISLRDVNILTQTFFRDSKKFSIECSGAVETVPYGQEGVLVVSLNQRDFIPSLIDYCRQNKLSREQLIKTLQRLGDSDE